MNNEFNKKIIIINVVVLKIIDFSKINISFHKQLTNLALLKKPSKLLNLI